ncbi:hypothetical protein [Sansalvadorimonas verongulae]|uniref:hypothetical protein n=1 Tax=Sansalvadorimonas verongulae TaxID=2172824 RepID=UPI0012BD498C|nr:hypothetical protein [Sansalvadorimonas verongulae]MTI13380.1 hypothetical protein [Sansalvadorimonas verongulae]
MGKHLADNMHEQKKLIGSLRILVKSCPEKDFHKAKPGFECVLSHMENQQHEACLKFEELVDDDDQGLAVG